ncbi:MAG: hypothetical protein ACXU8Z_02405 [Caulobacteraceae bacterium]
MPGYRLYFFDDNGRLSQTIALGCTTQDDAMSASLDRADGRSMELWHERRVVATFPAS